MSAKKFFSEHELGILKVLWGTKKPIARPQILEQMANPGISSASFHFAMNNLIEKGYVKVSGYERCGTNYGRTYTATKTRGDFILSMLFDSQANRTNQEGVTELMAAFVEKVQIDEKTISELENMLAKRREELEKRSQAKPETKE